MEGEWWQTDLDCKLQDWGLFVGGVMDVATRKVYTLKVLTWKAPYSVYKLVHEPAITGFGGLPECFSMDKGKENKVLAFAVMASELRRPVPQSKARQRWVPSKRNVRIERFWGYLNPRVMFPLKRVLVDMDSRGQIDTGIPTHLGAVQAVGSVLLQFGCDLALRRWHRHTVLSLGGKRQLGSPEEMSAAAPQLATKVPLIPAAEVEYATVRGLHTVPVWLGDRDPLHGRPVDQAQRSAAVANALGPLKDAWKDVLWNGGARFRSAVQVFLSYT